MDNAIERRWDSQVRSRQRRGILFEDRRERVGGARPLERPAAGEQLVHHAAEGEDVGAMIDRQATRLLGRHVADRAHDQPGRGVQCRGAVGGGGDGPRQTEVEHLDVSVAGDDDVGRLEIAMDDVPVVCGRERAGNLRPVFDRLSRRHRPARDDLGQRLTLKQLGDRVGARAIPADVIDRDDMGVGEAGERLHLALEARERVRIVRERRRQHLDRDVTAEALVACAIDLAHATSAERADNLVRP